MIVICLTVVSACPIASGQSPSYPLDELLQQVKDRFNVDLIYQQELVKEHGIQDTEWKNTDTVEQSLLQALTPHRLMFHKEDENRYRIQKFETGRRNPGEGRIQLEFLSHRYKDLDSWEKRKAILHSCMLEALELSTLPPKPDSNPIATSKRVMNGYTIQNIAIETLPGLFVSGSLYRPLNEQEKIPVILSPNGHFEGGRFRPDQQYRMATLARMGAMAFSYDLFGWGESRIQFNAEDHQRELAMSIQVLNGIRILDFLTELEGVDTGRIGITGGSGGGSQTMLLTALDKRIDVSVPVVMLSSYFNGGCPCEIGKPVHQCGGGTSNAEIAAMAAPRPQLVISDGNDWTAHVPEVAYPYLQKIYRYYGKEMLVENVHLPEERHDFGSSKRKAMYKFMARHLELDLQVVVDEGGDINETEVVIEPESNLYAFGKDGERLPERAVEDFKTLQEVFEKAVGSNL